MTKVGSRSHAKARSALLISPCHTPAEAGCKEEQAEALLNGVRLRATGSPCLAGCNEEQAEALLNGVSLRRLRSHAKARLGRVLSHLFSPAEAGCKEEQAEVLLNLTQLRAIGSPCLSIDAGIQYSRGENFVAILCLRC